MNLAALKSFCESKTYSKCKNHNLYLKYICFEEDCQQKLKSQCEICVKTNHSSHNYKEINYFYKLLINEIAESDFTSNSN